MTDIQARLARVRGVMTDMDGTLYIGGEAMPGAADFVRWAEADGRRRIVLTNNSSKAREVYQARLAALDMHVPLEDVLTSGDASAEWLAAHTALRRPYVLGTEALKAACVRAGLTPTALADEPDCVLLGYDTSLTYATLTDACLLVARDLPYYATHADKTCIDPRGLLPDAGAFIEAIATTTKGRRPTLLGKPTAAMLEAGLRRVGTPKDQTIMVGDQLDTDITLGAQHGVLCALVMTGETSAQMLAESPVQPDIVVPHVGALLALLKAAQGG
ncbi:MAG: HAD-IIA family hydrolase [Myxococcales bacterium]|nr:HAD-IIA family hydrolase [Myxococcales bacterium]